MDKIGFYVADSIFFDTFKGKNPEILSADIELVKEWEILQKAHRNRVDVQKLRSYEKRLGDPILWNAILSDRRLYFGKYTTFEQDYETRYGHEELLSILQVGIEEIEALFDRLKPDAVIGYVCVTVGEYLSLLIAKSRGIPIINLRPTRIENFYHAADHVSEPSKSTRNAYHRILQSGFPDGLQKKASQIIAKVRGENAMYDGVIPPPSAEEKRLRASRKISSFFSKMAALGKKYRRHRYGIYQHDNHYYGVLYPHFWNKIKHPFRRRMMTFLLGDRYVSVESLAKMEYAFFPLHKEPEVTLLVYSRPYLNQIEVIRHIARSLPAGTKLVVKEHPASVGYRPVSYYKKLLKIPNVLLAAPQETSRTLVEKAQLVTVIGGSVALEALMLKKPVVVLGNAPFIFLPETMLRKIENPDSLGWHIRDLMDKHCHDEHALQAYIAAVMDTSVPVNFYSELLGKGGYRIDPSHPAGEKKKQEDLNKLARYFLSQIPSNEPIAQAASR